MSKSTSIAALCASSLCGASNGDWHNLGNMRKHKLEWQLVRDFEDQWTKGNRAYEYGEWK